MSRVDQFNVTVSVTRIVNGSAQTRDLGTFDGCTGGEIDSEETKFHPGGLAEQITLGGRRNVNNVTVKRLYDLVRDHPIAGWLAGGVGKAEVVVTKTSITVDAAAVASPLVYKGKLKQLTLPDHDSESSDAALFEMEISSATVTQ